MLSYRHAFHAGNHADVLKHLVLRLCIEHLNGKDKPYLLLDTHAGAGIYSLDSGEAAKTGEFREGIARLWNRNDLPEALVGYVRAVRTCNAGQALKRYPGSPWFMATLCRNVDSLRYCELHPTDFTLLRKHIASVSPRAKLERADGFEAMKACLPPPSRRGLVLIDPPYEVKSDYLRVVNALKDGLKRFATGTYLVWVPFLPSIEARSLPEKLKKLPVEWLYASLNVRRPATQGHGMHGSGMFIINPPWTLRTALDATLPWLCDALALDEMASWQVQVSPQIADQASSS